MPVILIDGSAAPPETLMRRMLGVALVLWPLRALRRVASLDRVGVMTSEAGIIGLASGHGVYPLPPSPATRAAPGLIVDPLQPFITESTLRAALAAANGAAVMLGEFQTTPIERIRIEDEESFELASALARGLPPTHPAIAGLARLRLPLGIDIRLVVSDVDGTLTDGGVALGDSPHAQRTFHTHDGLGTHLLRQAGIKVAWLSATSSGRSIERRADMVGIDAVDAGEGPKGPRFIDICRRLATEPAQALYLGDDVNDLPAMRLAGLSACPADARPEVRAAADLVLEADGGRGAFRELADILISGVRRE